MASHGAARRAVEAGYTDVSVMVDGLKGWRAAGQPVVKLSERSETPRPPVANHPEPQTLANATVTV